MRKVVTGGFELPGYGSVRRKTMTKEQLLDLWSDIRERVQLDIKEGVRVEAIHPEGPSWRLVGPGWQDRAAAVVLALGRRGAPKELGVPGEQLSKVSYRLIEPEPFANKHVMIVGGGNAAPDCAIALANAKLCKSVSISYRRPELARLRSSVRKEIERCTAEGTMATRVWPDTRPYTAVLRVAGGAISTTGRRFTTRPCNLSRVGPSPRCCAARCRPRGTRWLTNRSN